MKKLLLFIPLQLFAMEQQDFIVYVTPEQSEPELSRESFITNDDVKRWAAMELDARDLGFTARLKVLSDKIDEHMLENGSAHTKTRVALVATVATSLCGMATTLITYFTTRHMGSN